MGLKAKETILALDLGTKTGWALKASPKMPIVSGVKDFKNGRFEGGGMRFLKFDKFLDFLYGSSGLFDAVYFEEVRRHQGVDAAHAYGGFMAHLTAWCEEKRIPYQGVPVGTIKKHVTGKGNANKDAVISAVKSLGHAPADDNEADALALMHYVLDEVVGNNES